MTLRPGPWVRRIGLFVLVLAAAGAALTILIHTPSARRLVLRYAVAEVQRRFGIRLEASRLDYNLPLLTVGLAQVRLAADRDAAVPFFEAEYIRASLTSAAFFGALTFDEIAVTGGRVRILRDASGTNLPESSGTPSAEPAALNITRLLAPGLTIELRDRVNDVSFEIPSVNLDVGRQSGRFELPRAATLARGPQTARISSFAGGMTFDGRTLKLSSVQLRADDVSGQLDGTLALFVREPAIDVRATGSTDLERLARWGDGQVGEPLGVLAFDAHVAGPLTNPITDIRLNAPRLDWSGNGTRGPALVVTDLFASSRVTTAAADIGELRFRIARGTITGRALVPFGESPARANLSWSGIDAAALTQMAAGTLSVSPSGTLSGELDGSGPLQRPAMWAATVRLRVLGGVTRRGLIAVAGDTRLALADGRWQIDGQERIAGVPAAITGAGRIGEDPPANWTLNGRVSIGDTDALALLRAIRASGLADVPEQIVSSGTLSASATLSGQLGAPDITAAIRLRDVAGTQFRFGAVDAMVSGRPLDSRLMFSAVADRATIADQAVQNVQTMGRLDGSVVRIESLSAAQAGAAGTLSIGGTYDLRRGEYEASLDLANWAVTPVTDRPFEGTAHATFHGTGTVREPYGNGSVRIETASWNGSPIGDLTAELRLDGAAAEVSAQVPRYNATLTSSTRIKAPFVTTADVRIDAVDLESLANLRGPRTPGTPPVTGTATVTAHAEGALQNWRDAVAVADVPVLDARVGELPIHLASPARVQYERQTVRVGSLEVDAGATRISAAGELPLSVGSGTLLVTALGDIGETARAAAAIGIAHVPITGSGPLALLTRITGSLERPLIAADLEAGPGSVLVEGFSPATGVVLRAHVGNDTIDVREVHASYEGATLEAMATVPLALVTSAVPRSASPASLHATVARISPDVLRGFVDPTTLEDIRGNVDLSVNLEAPSFEIARISGDLTLTRFDVQLSGLQVTQRVPTRIVAGDGFARVESWNWEGEGATVGVFGQVRLSDRQAALIANADVDLRVLTPFVRSAGMATAGRLTPRVSLTGPIDRPRIDGDVLLDGGEIRLQDPRIVVNGLNARAALTRTNATLTALTGSINGGSLTGNGEFEYQPEAGAMGKLVAQIRDMPLEFPAGLRTELDADLQLDVMQQGTNALPAGTLSGTVTVLRGAYREPLAIVGGLLAAVRARQTAATGGTGASEQASFLNRLALSIRLQTDEDLIVDNNYARVELGADLDIIGTAAAPGMSGRAILREDGRLFVGRNVYTINSDVPSTIDFVSPTTIAPELNISLATRVGREDIDVTLQGPAESPQVDMSSTSGLGQADITALLLTGRTLDQLSTADASFIGTQVIGNFSGEVLGFAGRAVGLDTLRLGGVEDTITQDVTTLGTETDPTSRLTFGKGLGSSVNVTFSQSLREASAQTWIVDYLPERRVELRVVSDDNNLLTFRFRHDVAFGASTSTATRSTSAAARQVLRVADVRLMGELGFPEERIRSLLKLKAGDRFDFARWQDDRDRIEDFYHQNEHLAARVTANRMAAGDEVTLSYVVNAGPRTVIAVTGFDLGLEILERLRVAWAASIFDEFLVDEANQIVKSTLIDNGYPQPVATTQIVHDADVATMRIDVQPGARTTETVIRIQSPDPQITEELQERVEAAGLASAVVRDPGQVARDLTSDLRSQGYLRARVSVGSPLVQESTTTIPVNVESGPAFLIDTVTFNGRMAVSPEDVANAAGVMAGAPFDPSVIDAAQGRLVALYRRRGFASATVEPRTTVRVGEPRVDVVFEIHEGFAQTVGDVVVTGEGGVDTDVIVRAMRLPLGATLEPEEVVRARTRIFNTGLFRRVDVTTETIERGAADRTQPMRVRVTVEAWPALRLRYGFTAAQEESDTSVDSWDVVPGFSADVTRRTVFGRALSLAGAFEYQQRERVVRGVATAPTMMSLPIQTSLAVERSRQEIAQTRIADRNSISWEEKTRFAQHLSLSYVYTYERNHTFVTVQRPGEPTFDIRTPIARMVGSIAWDSRSDPVDPVRGLLLSLSGAYAPESLGSAFRFSKYVGQAYSFNPWRDVVFASAARVGSAWGLGGQVLVPSERFFAGGARTVRGVPEDSLGEQDFFGPIGGRALLVLNQEVRFPIFKWLRGVGFVDAGNVFLEPSQMKLGDLTGSFGAGLRLSTPFALLRADYGKVAWGPDSASRSGRWTFGLGQAF